jgi:hypothetical protein
MESDQWPAIRQSVKETLGTDIRPSALVEAVKIHFWIA